MRLGISQPDIIKVSCLEVKMGKEAEKFKDSRETHFWAERRGNELPIRDLSTKDGQPHRDTKKKQHFARYSVKYYEYKEFMQNIYQISYKIF